MAGTRTDRRRQLAHLLSTRTSHALGMEQTVHEYALRPITVPRPATGRLETQVQCGTCKELIRCTVDSPPARRRRRFRWALASAGTLAGLAAVNLALIWPLVSAFPHHTAGIVITVLAAGFPVTFIALAVAGVTFHKAWSEDGIRLLAPPSTLHTLRPEGSRREVHSRDTGFHEPGF